MINQYIKTDILIDKMKKYIYCQLVGEENFVGSAHEIKIDYGHGVENLEDENDEVIETTSMIYAANYLTRIGWEFVQAFAVTQNPHKDIVYWIFRKEASEEELDMALVIY